MSEVFRRFPTIVWPPWPFRPKRFTKRFWLTQSDARVCPYCEEINEINSEGVDYETGVFLLPNGKTKGGPPAHRLCRCTVFFR